MTERTKEAGAPRPSGGDDPRLAPLRDLGSEELQIHEVYASIQGESTFAGRPCTFVRTSACHLRCRYCDTRQAFVGGERVSVAQLLTRVKELALPLVEVTGGEPLLQPAIHDLMRQLCDAGYTVLLETSGSLDISAVDPRVVKIVDMKAPSSGEQAHNDLANLSRLGSHDELKLVLGDRNDFEWARALLARHRPRCTVLMGSVYGVLAIEQLAAWILEDRLAVRLQVQLHKLIWHPEATGV